MDVKNVNRTKVYDLIYRKMDALLPTKDGIMKQPILILDLNLFPLAEFDQEHEEILDLLEIIKFKTGNEYLDEEFDVITELGRDLKRIYEFKKITDDLCGNKGKFSKGNPNPTGKMLIVMY